MTDQYQRETFKKTGPNGEPLKLTVSLHYDNDAEYHNADIGVRERDLRSPCYHIPSGTLIMGDPKRWEPYLSDVESQREHCHRLARLCDCSPDESCDDCEAIPHAWEEYRLLLDALKDEDYSPEAEKAIQRNDSRLPTWANLGTEYAYEDLPKAERITYLEADGSRVRSYCYNSWHHTGVIATVKTEAGEVIGESACWGFESDDDGLKNLESHDVAKDAMYQAEKELTERHRAACAGIETERS